MGPRKMNCVLPVLAIIFLVATAAIAGAEGRSGYILVSADADTVCAIDGKTGKILFGDPDLLKVLEWAMMNSRITVLGGGTYAITNPISIPRPGVALIIDESAIVRLDYDSVPRDRPSKPRIPVIYNQGHDDVKVVNLGRLYGKPGRDGRGIFFDGRSDGDYGINGGCIVDAGIDEAGDQPDAFCGRALLDLVDCVNVEIPLLFGDGYKVYPVIAEGCRNLDIGTVVSSPRPSNRPVNLNGMNTGTKVRRLIAAVTMGQSGVLVRSSPNTIVHQVSLYGNPLKHLKAVHVHEYGLGGSRFTQRPHIDASDGARALKTTIVQSKIKSWPQSVALEDFPGSLPDLKVKVKLSAICAGNTEEVIIDKIYDLSLLSAEEYVDSPRPVFIFADGDISRAENSETGKVLFENADAKEVIEWAMNNSPITVLQKGVFTVDKEVVVPRENVSLIINKEAELGQDPEIIPDPMPGGRGGYRTLIHNPGHDNVKVINFGTLRPYDRKRGVAIHFDGRSEGKLGIDGGLIFSTGMMYADDVVWVVDSKNIRIPLLIGRGYGNAPLALEGVEDTEIGIIAALMGDKAFENEAIDFNSYCRNVRVDLVVGTTPTEEVIDINNSPDCIIKEVRVYRSPGDAMSVRVDNWPEWKKDHRNLVTLMPLIYNSEGTVLHNERKVEKEVVEWVKSLEVSPLSETLPRIEMKARLQAVFEDGTRQVVLDETFELNIRLFDLGSR